MELIRIEEKDGKQLVSARELYKFLECSERFGNWFERQLQYGFIENSDYTGCKVFNTLANKELQDYAVTIDMAKEISMIQRSEKGKEARKYFIACEKAWNSPEAIMARALQMSQRTLESYKDKVLVLERKIEDDKPRVSFAETIEKSSDAILVRDMSKLLANEGIKCGERKLYTWLRGKGLIMKNSTKPTQRAVEMGIFVVNERVIKTVAGDRISITTKVTGKGQLYILQKFKEAA